MQAKPRTHRIALVVLVVSLVLGACGGGDGSGSTWFNLPSLPLQIQPDGTGRVFGFSTGAAPLLQPAMVQQFQSLNIQQLEVRLGHNGIHVYANGQDLPYIAWDDESVVALKSLIPRVPNLPNASLIANYLDLPRTIGLGFTLKLPVASGQQALSIPSWSGETAVSSSQSVDLGEFAPPVIQAGLLYGPDGVPSIEGISIAEIEQAFGMALPLTLDANTMAMISALQAQEVALSTQPNGLDVFFNGSRLLRIAYDQAYLERTVNLAGPLLPVPDLTPLLQSEIVPLVPGAKVDLTVSFGGQAVAISH